MNVSFQLASPNNCNHVHVAVTTPEGTQNFVFTRQDFQLEPEDMELAVKVLIRYFAKTNNLSTLAQLKTALEGKTFKL